MSSGEKYNSKCSGLIYLYPLRSGSYHGLWSGSQQEIHVLLQNDTNGCINNVHKQGTSKKEREGERQHNSISELVHKSGLDLSTHKFSHISKMFVTGVWSFQAVCAFNEEKLTTLGEDVVP